MKRFFLLIVGLMMSSSALAVQLVVVRHGQARQNVLKIVNSDIANSEKYPLTEKGLKQVIDAAERLRFELNASNETVSAVYVSPLLRTRQTAHVIVDNLNVDPRKIIIEPLIRENELGTMEEVTEEELAAFTFSYSTWDFSRAHEYDGETEEDLQRRLQVFLDKVRSAHHSGLVLVVTHGSPALALTTMLSSGNEKMNQPNHAEFRTLELK